MHEGLDPWDAPAEAAIRRVGTRLRPRPRSAAGISQSCRTAERPARQALARARPRRQPSHRWPPPAGRPRDDRGSRSSHRCHRLRALHRRNFCPPLGPPPPTPGWSSSSSPATARLRGPAPRQAEPHRRHPWGDTDPTAVEREPRCLSSGRPRDQVDPLTLVDLPAHRRHRGHESPSPRGARRGMTRRQSSAPPARSVTADAGSPSRSDASDFSQHCGRAETVHRPQKEPGFDQQVPVAHHRSLVPRG